MNKSITISFRTSEYLRNMLEKISKEERRSVSSTIENILYKYSEDKGELKNVEKEKRRYPRKKVFLPASLAKIDSNDQTEQAGMVLDISLGGLQISIPDSYRFEIQEGLEHSKISVVFELPKDKNRLNMQCLPRRVVRTNGDAVIGASFADNDFTYYQTIQQYLMN